MEDISELFGSDGIGYEQIDDQGIFEHLRAEPETSKDSDREWEIPKVAEVALCPVFNSEAMEAFERVLFSCVIRRRQLQ